MSIHETIKREREARQWSMEELAAKVSEIEGLTKPLAWQTVQQWEKNGGTAPKRKRLEAVAQLFGMPVSALLGEVSTTPGAAGNATASMAPPTLAQALKVVASQIDMVDDAGQRQLIAQRLQTLAMAPDSEKAMEALLAAMLAAPEPQPQALQGIVGQVVAKKLDTETVDFAQNEQSGRLST